MRTQNMIIPHFFQSILKNKRKAPNITQFDETNQSQPSQTIIITNKSDSEQRVRKNVCVLDEYYAIPGIVSKYGANVIELENLVVENVLDGTCDYIIADSTGQIEGMVESQNSFIEFGEPYAIAVSQEQKDTLGKNISAALVDIMDDGAESEILQFEQENLVAFGFAPNKKLADIVMTITAAGGALSPELEDAIWNE
eukprot:TRINITY_DN12019_c0_g2_i2.p2 TRINITY_DN12019_c0_g2~~TRINITY_DN12019_c0_g2_i2.p2  ORF type:complete len:197 (+),score=28.94 TRINITY_DN12019_c0_g2_i2:85-675(+)